MKRRSKKFYFFNILLAIVAIWALVVWLDQDSVAVLHEDASAYNLARADEAPGVVCEERVIPVALEPGGKLYNLVGDLCFPEEFASGNKQNTLQVLISGAGYGSVYWDFPYKPDTYSYMRAALRAGDTTFNFDRLGMGESDHPFGILLDVDRQAHVLHQVITALTTEASYAAVVTLGHSFGSVIALSHALTHPDQVDGLVLTGYAHNVNPEFGPSMGQSIDVAAFKGPFVGDVFDPTYVVSKNNSRGDAFYTLSNTEKEVVEVDNLTRQTTAAGELITMSKYFADQSKKLQVPTYMILGEDDFVVCGGELDCTNHEAVAANEAPYFPPQTCFELTVLEDTKHNASLHRNAPEVFELMLGWIYRRAGSAGEPPLEPCV